MQSGCMAKFVHRECTNPADGLWASNRKPNSALALVCRFILLQPGDGGTGHVRPKVRTDRRRHESLIPTLPPRYFPISIPSIFEITTWTQNRFSVLA